MEKNEFTTKEELKAYFGTGKYPTQSQFSDFIDSYWHKEENIESQETLATVVNRNNKIPEQGIKFLQNGTTPSTRVELRVNPKTWSQWFGNMNPDHTGIYNQSFGYGALQEITTGSENVALGNHALWKLTTGIRNTVVGSASMNALKEGNWNVVVGQATLYYFASGTNNTAVGRVAMSNFIGGYGNTALGSHSGFVDGGTLHTQEYNYNTFLGFRSGYTTDLPNNLKGHNNVTIGANAPIGGETNNKLVIHSSETVLNHNTTLPLIGGDFVERTLDFDSSLKVHRLPQADSTFTKSIVAKPDGTFGWEEKTNQQSSSGNIATTDLTNTQARVFTQNANFTWDTLGKPYYLKGLTDIGNNTTDYPKVLKLNPTTKQVVEGDALIVTIPDTLPNLTTPTSQTLTIVHTYTNSPTALDTNVQDLNDFIMNIGNLQFTNLTVNDWNLINAPNNTAATITANGGVVLKCNNINAFANGEVMACAYPNLVLPMDKNWVFTIGGTVGVGLSYHNVGVIGITESSATSDVGMLNGFLSSYSIGWGYNSVNFIPVTADTTPNAQRINLAGSATCVFTKVGNILNITVRAGNDARTFNMDVTGINSFKPLCSLIKSLWTDNTNNCITDFGKYWIES